MVNYNNNKERSLIKRVINRFGFALTFLTRLPFPGKIKYNDKLPSRSMGLYPLIGLIIGSIIFTFDYLVGGFLPPRLTNVFVLTLFVYITGGLHLDGLIDTADGIFSCREKEKIIEIMHDSLIGAFGAIAMFLTLLLKYSLLMELQGTYRGVALIVAPIISRWMVVYAAKQYPKATESKLGRSFNYELGIKQVVEATVFLILGMVIVFWLFNIPFYSILLAFMLSLLVTMAFSHYIINKLDGLTGDIYGAINEIVELVVMFLFVVNGF